MNYRNIGLFQVIVTQPFTVECCHVWREPKPIQTDGQLGYVSFNPPEPSSLTM